jgi:hypothetical protein
MNHENKTPRPHRTVIVEVGPWREEIDVGLAPLITEMWKAGIETMMCCQEVELGIAWIEFSEIKELYRFLNLVTRYEPGSDTRYNRINWHVRGPMSTPEWTYQFNLHDMFEGEEEQTIHELARFYATVGVYFPATDISVLLQRLRVHNQA